MVAQSTGLLNIEEEKRAVAELCGFGGIYPFSADRSTWNGQVRFDSGKSFISYREPHDKQNSLFPLTILRRAWRALDRFCDAAGRLQRGGLCCDSFTVLVLSEPGSPGATIRMNRVELVTATQLRKDVLECIKDDRILPHVIITCGMAAVSVLRQFFFPETFYTESVVRKGDVQDNIRAISLAVQCLCIGFLSYCQAHVGAIHPFFLDSPQQDLILGYADSMISGPSKIARWSLMKLTCIGEMLKDPVLVLSTYSVTPDRILADRVYDLSATPEDLVDTWSPGYFLYGGVDYEKLQAIAIQGGWIYPVAGNRERMHWSKSRVDFNANTASFLRTERIVIGADVTVNRHCTRPKNNLEPYQPYLENLGTSPEHWKLIQKQLALSLSQIGGGQAAFTWQKVPGRTIKDGHLGYPERSVLNLLDDTWGLQFSLCTGVIKRVAIRVLMADVIEDFVASVEPYEHWQKLAAKGMVANMKQAGFVEWVRKLPQDERSSCLAIIRGMLDLLQETGVRESEKKFAIAWIRKNDIFRGFKIPYPESHWINILADSPQCLTVACITTNCFETDGIRCKGQQATWPTHGALLQTEVSRHARDGGQQMSAQTTAFLGNQAKYFIGKPGAFFKGTVELPQPNLQPRLLVKPSTIPPEYIPRIMKKAEYIRERQNPQDAARGVLIQPGKSAIT